MGVDRPYIISQFRGRNIVPNGLSEQKAPVISPNACWL